MLGVDSIKNAILGVFPITVGGETISLSAEFTRPADTTAYTANDAVSNSTSSTTPVEIANFARVNGQSGYIVGARLTTDKKSITPRIRVHLYSVNTATLSVDNAAWQDKYADISKRLGSFDLPAMSTGADTTNSDISRSMDFTVRIPFKCASDSRSIYYVLETLDAFTPASGQKFTLTLNGELN